MLALVLGIKCSADESIDNTEVDLESALLTARLKLHLDKALTLENEKTFTWSESSTVILWLNSKNRLAEVFHAKTAH